MITVSFSLCTGAIRVGLGSHSQSRSGSDDWKVFPTPLLLAIYLCALVRCCSRRSVIQSTAPQPE